MKKEKLVFAENNRKLEKKELLSKKTLEEFKDK